jgi:2-polyprenyl-3-methyl-5-hydroxy-6-metoxy-1,4-benzoquinol methylase
MTDAGSVATKMNEGIRVQEVRSCSFCGGKGVSLYENVRDRLFDVAGNWTLVRCPKCQLVWIDPCPIPEDIGKLYSRYASHLPPDQSPGRFAKLWNSARYSLMATTLGYKSYKDDGVNPRLGRLLSWFGLFADVGRGAGMWLESSEPGQLLDVGCGAGQFLSRMEKFGWQVSGVEPDQDAVKVARESFGLNVYPGTLEEANFAADTFDAVTLNHVIEHVHDPVNLLKACWRVLKPGGRFVVVTPNIDSLAHRWLGLAWLHLDPPRHLLLFSQGSLKQCAIRAGLRVQNVRSTARAAGGTWYMSRLVKRHGKLPGLSMSPQNPSLPLLMEGVVFWILEHLVVKVRPCGEEIVLIATK